MGDDEQGSMLSPTLLGEGLDSLFEAGGELRIRHPALW
jgi:hypothetical protein